MGVRVVGRVDTRVGVEAAGDVEAGVIAATSVGGEVGVAVD
jgi:hypothetical protein